MGESFSQDTKIEICSFKVKMKCCKKSTLYGMLYGATQFDSKGIILETENPVVLKYYSRLMKEVCGLNFKNDIASANIIDENIIKQITNTFSVSDNSLVNSNIFDCEMCKWAFVRGVFLSCGTITAPDNSYHMEFHFRSKDSAYSFSDHMTSLGEAPKVIERKDMFGVYYKDSENVIDVLGQIGASVAAFKLLDVKILKDLRNNANRAANCEVANIQKTVQASNEQMSAINRIIESGKADELPEELRQTLDLRAAFPSDTLSELAQRHTPEITKSGVNHRLKRLIEFSKKC